MTFLRSDLLTLIFPLLFVLLYFFWKSESTKNDFIEKTFFKRKTFVSKLRNILFYTGIVLLAISALDPRGPQEKMDSQVRDQKTIVIIDSSASMLAEDVRPNRFKKSLLMARHFIKKAYGHKIAVVLFSDTQKRLVPFTDDLDLLDARVAGLEKLELYNGGSNISQAIKESLGYFRLDSKDSETISGNLLVFTDSEGHDDGFKISLPDQVSLAVVGVGTARGARIPNRDKYGVFRGYKKFDGKEVVTKLNEKWLKSLESVVDTYSFWIANSYTIPTEEILSFFNRNYQQRINKAKITVRPVKVNLFLVPALLCFFFSFSLYIPSSFGTLALFFMLINPSNIQALSLTAEELENSIKKGSAGDKGKLKLAELYLKDKKFELSRILYEEVPKKKLSLKDRNNYAISLLGEKKISEALVEWSQLQRDLEKTEASDEVEKSIRQNVLLALQRQKSGKGSDNKKDKKDKEKQKDDQDNKKDGQEGKKQEKNSSKGKGKDKKKEDKKREGKKKASDKFEKNKKKKMEQKPKSLKEQQEEIRKKRKMVKVPAIIKQIMSDDRNLQQEYLDTSTKEPNSREKKDW